MKENFNNKNGCYSEIQLCANLPDKIKRDVSHRDYLPIAQRRSFNKVAYDFKLGFSTSSWHLLSIKMSNLLITFVFKESHR